MKKKLKTGQIKRESFKNILRNLFMTKMHDTMSRFKNHCMHYTPPPPHHPPGGSCLMLFLQANYINMYLQKYNVFYSLF
jgi:hypothetical protein